MKEGKINPEMKIVIDSSGDTRELDGVQLACAPLKVITSEKEFVDDANANVRELIDHLSTYTGKSHSSCPSPNDWLEAFGDAKYVFCITITSHLSGSYNSACVAKRDYETQHPDRRVFVIDSLSTGPEMRLIAERLADLIKSGMKYDDICSSIVDYQKNADLFFILSSLKTLANNGRVNKIVAKIAGILGIRIVGKASDEGELALISKCRGIKNALSEIINNIKAFSKNIKKIRITHVFNEAVANQLKDMLIYEFGNIDIEIYPTGILCGYYAENNGILVGVERY